MAGEEDEGGDVEISSPPEYCSLSERIVTPDSARLLERSSEAIVGFRSSLFANKYVPENSEIGRTVLTREIARLPKLLSREIAAQREETLKVASNCSSRIRPRPSPVNQFHAVQLPHAPARSGRPDLARKLGPGTRHPECSSHSARNNHVVHRSRRWLLVHKTT